jgi:hypothetical protein
MIPAGNYTAKATGSFDFGTSTGGTEQVAVEVEILEGPEAGRCMTWFGFFTDKTTERTVESLRLLGWQGDDITKLEELGSRRVSIVVEHEEYQGQVRAKIQWVNRLGGLGVKLKAPMDDAARRKFAARMKGFAKAKPALPPEDPAVLQRQGAPAPNGGNGESAYPSEPEDDGAPPHDDSEIGF